MHFFDPFLESDLEKFKHIQLSSTPDVPGTDELINHIILDYKVIETKTGFLLLIDVMNPKTNEEYKYSFPDIQDVEFNQNSNSQLAKYYLHCIQRENYEEITRIKNKEELGKALTEREKQILIDKKEYVTYRLMLTN